jgi:predicted pyridoxine 5'-phosphate oxidase superfamily flavin-nucleotide-binding protein
MTERAPAGSHETQHEQDALEHVLGSPSPRVRHKVSPILHDWLVQFINLSPFVVIASSDEHGRVDASPRGGPPGFVRAIDERTLVLPECSGNRLFQTLRNVGTQAGVGLLFLIPGVDESARVNGNASVVLNDDPRWKELITHFLETEKETYIGAQVIRVTEGYYHCGRSSRFASLWDPEAIARHRTARPIPKRPTPAN